MLSIFELNLYKNLIVGMFHFQDKNSFPCSLELTIPNAPATTNINPESLIVNQNQLQLRTSQEVITVVRLFIIKCDIIGFKLAIFTQYLYI